MKEKEKIKGKVERKEKNKRKEKGRKKNQKGGKGAIFEKKKTDSEHEGGEKTRERERK